MYKTILILIIWNVRKSNLWTIVILKYFSCSWWLTESLPRCVWNLQGKDDTYPSNQARLGSELLCILLRDLKLTRESVPTSKTGYLLILYVFTGAELREVASVTFISLYFFLYHLQYSAMKVLFLCSCSRRLTEGISGSIWHSKIKNAIHTSYKAWTSTKFLCVLLRNN